MTITTKHGFLMKNIELSISSKISEEHVILMEANQVKIILYSNVFYNCLS